MGYYGKYYVFDSSLTYLCKVFDCEDLPTLLDAVKQFVVENKRIDFDKIEIVDLPDCGDNNGYYRASLYWME